MNDFATVGLFRGTAWYYARYRPGYPPELFRHLKRTFNLNGSGRLLDLGCGTGQLALPLAPLFKEVVALDPDGAMLAEGAAGCRARNVRWRQGSSADLARLAPDLGRFQLVTIGRAFHRMDRDQTLTDLYNLFEPNGGLAILGDGEPIWDDLRSGGASPARQPIQPQALPQTRSGEVSASRASAPGTRRAPQPAEPQALPQDRGGEACLARQPHSTGFDNQNRLTANKTSLPSSNTWQSTIRAVVQHFLGTQRRAGPQLYAPPTEQHEAVLARSKFINLQRLDFPYQRTWTVDHLIGYLLSTSYASPALLGDNTADFKHAVRTALSGWASPITEGVALEIITATRK